MMLIKAIASLAFIATGALLMHQAKKKAKNACHNSRAYKIGYWLVAASLSFLFIVLLFHC